MVWLIEMVCNMNGQLVSYAGSMVVCSDVQLARCASNVLFFAFGAG